jgi:hypothetical protein
MRKIVEKSEKYKLKTLTSFLFIVNFESQKIKKLILTIINHWLATIN